MTGTNTLRGAGVVLLVVLAAAMALFGSLVGTGGTAHAGHNSATTGEKGTTGGWLDGEEVTFLYNKDFFCSQPPAAESMSGCIVGEEPQTAPRPGSNIPVLYVMTPLFEYDADFQATLQCPVNGSCINHPQDLDVSPVFGDGTIIPLPPHSHIVDERRGGWWEIEVIGVTDRGVWDELAAAKSLDRVRELQDEGTGITGDIPSNLYLWFNVAR